MGTDIHMIAERCINGKWTIFKEKVFNSCYDSDNEDKTFIPYDGRNYNLFGILADVRNGTGFAGCRTGERFNSISLPKGLPDDIDKESEDYLWGGHSDSWLTLKEIEVFDWNQMHRDYGVVDEASYRDCVMQGKEPLCWCGDISGPDIIKLTENEMVDLIQNKFPRNDSKHYYTGCYFSPCPYRDSAEFFLKQMEVLKKYIPDGCTTEDVRIVFNFDS